MRVWTIASVLGVSWLVCISACGCSVDTPEGVFACEGPNQCPEGWVCALNGYCYSSTEAIPRGAGGDRQAAINECREDVPPGVAENCTTCACEDCTIEVLACGNDCWTLLGCAQQRCANADNQCLVDNCFTDSAGDFDPALNPAVNLLGCLIRSCLQQCRQPAQRGS